VNEAETRAEHFDPALGMGRLVLLSHDRKTIASFPYDRVSAGLPMPGISLVGSDMPIVQAIDELLIAIQCLSADACANLVRYFQM
jgi:hypothetical protein